MAPSAIVALCLLALVSAAPQNLQNFQCATSCDLTRQAHIGMIGKTYSFNYNVQSSVKLVGVNEGVTKGGFTGVVDVSRINPCELAIKFTSSNEAVKVNKYPLLVSIIGDGQFGKVCAHPEDDSESINIKKGIASAIQYSLPSFAPTKKQIVSERSVLGTCPTAYSIENNGQEWVVKKENVHSECQDHLYSHSEIPSILSKSPMPLQVSKSVCTQVFSSNKVPQKITCKDTKVVRPAYGAYKYIEATQESTLQFTSESTDIPVLISIKGVQLLRKELSYDHSMPAKNPALVAKLDAVLSNVCEMAQGQGHQETASTVNKAIELMRHIPDNAFVIVLNKIRAGHYCADYTKLEALYMDAIAFIGEPGALQVIAQEVSAGRATGGRTALYTAALHLLSKPTVKHVAALAPIASMEGPTSALILAAASVVNRHCKLSGCENTPAVKDILNRLTDKLVNQCTPSFSNSNPVSVITTLKTLGNIGHLASEHAEKVINCAKTEGVETNVRFAATMVLKGASCKKPVKKVLQDIVLNKSMITEIRIGSYLAAIKCADVGDLQEIIAKIMDDSNKQVRTFVMSHLNNLKDTRWPVKGHLQKLLHNVNVPMNYESNIFKYSRNFEMSYNMPNLGVGAAVDSNVVFTPESYIPRLVNIGLDMNLLGSFVNIGEMGVRVEGIDPIMKEVFGPESYLHKTPLAEVFKDTSLFIKHNGANIFHNLEKIIRQNKSLDIKSLIQSVSKFLKANNIKLPKTDLYAKLMGQEYAFISLAGPMQEVNIYHVVETITSAVVDALRATKDFNLNTARAAHFHVDYTIPTIQGVPLKIKLESTAVTGIQVQSKLDSNYQVHDALLKFIPSVSLAIEGKIGYGAIMKHGLKMKNAIHSSNKLALYVNLKNGQDLEWKLELPERMELINVKSEVYQVNINNLMVEEKIYPNNINDARIAKKYCSAIVEPVTGLHICFNMNIPDVLKSNSLPLGMPTHFNIYLQKSDVEMKGYRVAAALKNKADKKVLKVVVGTYGAASSTESSVKFVYNKEANSYQTAAEIKSLWFTIRIEGRFIHQADLISMQFLAHHQFKGGAPNAVAWKFDVKKVAIANGNEYHIKGFAGLTEILTETHKFLNVKMIHAKYGEVINADLVVNVESSVLPLAIEFGVDVPAKAPWFTVIRKVELKATVGVIAVEGLVLRKMPGQYENIFAIQHGEYKVIFIKAMHNVAGNIFANFNWITEASAKLGNKNVGTTLSFKHEYAVIDTNWEWRNEGAKVFNINVKHSMESRAYTTTLEIGLPTLPKTVKFSNVINVVEFMSYKIMTDVYMDNTALLQIEGPVSLQISKEMIKHNMDFKISGAFGGKFKVMNAALLSLKKIQYTLDMRHSTTPITMIDITIDRTNAAQTTAKAIVHIPVLVKAEFGATVTSGMLHTTVNTFILPTTSLARRFKGYTDLNLKEQKMKLNFFWDAEKDTTKKIALNTGFKIDHSMGKVLVQGDLAVTTLVYGFKLEAMMASPFAWFLGTSGVEIAVTAPSNKVMVVKALCTVDHAGSILKIKRMVALQTFDENKYEITGSFAIKRLPAIWNADITSEFTVNIPQIQKITVATQLIHEDRNAACAIVLKTRITGITKPIAFEITHGASEDKYTTLFKVQHGSTVASVATNVELISGIKAFDATVDASLPFAVVKALSMRVTKTAEGAITWTFAKNQMVLTKLHYLMKSWTAHTLRLEAPSRTIEFIVNVSGNEIIMKVFPEKNLSSKMHKAIIRLIFKVESAHIECFVNTPSLSKEVRIAAEFSLADPTMGKMVNVNIHLPTSEIKTFVFAILEDLVKIYEDLIKDGLIPNMIVVYNELKLTLRELPRHLNNLIQIVTSYWKILRNWALRMWKNYEADVIALVKAVHAEVLHYWGVVLHYWEVLKVEVPILLNEVVAIVKKSEMWKMLWGFVNQIFEQFPVMYNILLDFYNKVIFTAFTEIKELVNRIMNLPSFRLEKLWKILTRKLPIIWAKLKQQLLNTELMNILPKYLHILKMQMTKYLHILKMEITKILTRFWNPVWNWVMDIWRNYEADVIGLIWFVHAGFLHYFEILRINVPILYNDIMAIVKNTEIWRMLHGMINKLFARFPVMHNILLDVYHKVILTAVIEIQAFAIQIMNLPSFQFEALWKLLKTELPAISAKLRKQLLNAELTTFINKNLNNMKEWFPTVHAAMFDIWARVIKPVWAEFVTMFRNLMKINFTNLPQIIDHLLKEVPVFVNNIVTHLMGGFLHYWEILLVNVPILYNDIMAIVKNTETWKMLHGMINEMIELFPVIYNILVDFYDKVIWTTFTEIEELVIKIINIPSLRFEPLWKLLKNELPAIWAKLRKQLLNAELTTFIIKNWNNMKKWFPTVHAAMFDIWARVIKPVWAEFVTMFRNLMNMHFTDISQMINHLLKEIPALVNNIVKHLMDKEVVRMVISMMNELIEGNPMIKYVFQTVIDVCHNIMMALWGDLVMLSEKLMNMPLIKKFVAWVQHIVLSSTINMEFPFHSVKAVVHSFATQVLGVTVAGDRISAVVPLPVSVFTLRPIWRAGTVHIPAAVAEFKNLMTAVMENIPIWVVKEQVTVFVKLVDEKIPVIARMVETHVLKVINEWVPVLMNFIENIPVLITRMKEHVIVLAKLVAEQILVIVKVVKAHVPKFINELVPVISEWIELLMNTELVKFLMAKIDLVIMMYPTQLNAMRVYFERFFGFAVENLALFYMKVMEIPIFKRIVENIWELIYPKNINTRMLSSMNMVSSSSSNLSSFIKLHTPSVVSSYLSHFIQ